MSDQLSHAAPHGVSFLVPVETKDGATRNRRRITKPELDIERVGVATLKVSIGQQLMVSLLPEGNGWDMRGQWGDIVWVHYRALAEGIANVIAAQLKLPQTFVVTTPSILIGGGVAEPRLIIEVPVEHKEAVASVKVWSAIQYVVDIVTGAVALDTESVTSDTGPTAVAANDAVMVGEDVTPINGVATLVSTRGAETRAAMPAVVDLFNATARNRLQSVARKVLSKVGGATLPVPCHIHVDGLTCAPLEVVGRCADKPKRRSSSPATETFECFVDGFVRSRHTVYLVDATGNGSAKEVSMEPGWERRVAIYAASRYRGLKFQATVVAESNGDKTRRELVDLSYIEQGGPAPYFEAHTSQGA